MDDYDRNMQTKIVDGILISCIVLKIAYIFIVLIF